jgi:AcrR family transcriptional regulator
VPSITRRSHGNRAKRRDEVRERLLMVVEQLLDAGESFAEISVERLVAEAGLSRSTFYVYFEDKGDLLRAWFGKVTAELEQASGAWWRLGPEVERSDLRAALGQIVGAYRPHTPLMSALYDLSAYDTIAREEVTGMMDANVAGLVKHMRRGQREGWIDPSLQPKETALWLMWMAERGLHQMVRGGDDAEIELLVDAFTDVIWNTLYATTRRSV